MPCSIISVKGGDETCCNIGPVLVFGGAVSLHERRWGPRKTVPYLEEQGRSPDSIFLAYRTEGKMKLQMGRESKGHALISWDEETWLPRSSGTFPPREQRCWLPQQDGDSFTMIHLYYWEIQSCDLFNMISSIWNPEPNRGGLGWERQTRHSVYVEFPPPPRYQPYCWVARVS